MQVSRTIVYRLLVYRLLPAPFAGSSVFREQGRRIIEVSMMIKVPTAMIRPKLAKPWCRTKAKAPKPQIVVRQLMMIAGTVLS